MRNKLVLLHGSPKQTSKTVSLETTEDISSKHIRFICSSLLHTSSAEQTVNGHLLFFQYFMYLLDAHLEIIMDHKSMIEFQQRNSLKENLKSKEIVHMDF